MSDSLSLFLPLHASHNPTCCPWSHGPGQIRCKSPLYWIPCHQSGICLYQRLSVWAQLSPVAVRANSCQLIPSLSFTAKLSYLLMATAKSTLSSSKRLCYAPVVMEPPPLFHNNKVEIERVAPGKRKFNQLLTLLLFTSIILLTGSMSADVWQRYRSV